jgi:hypothetical protein
MTCSTDGCFNPVSWYAKLATGGVAAKDTTVVLAVCLTCAMTALRLGGTAKTIGGKE